MHKYHIQIFLLFLLVTNTSLAQDITAYEDNRNHLYVFEKGLFREIESLRPLNYKVGGTAVAFIDHKNDFKIFTDGQEIQLVNAADFSYSVTDYLVSFRVGNVLYVFDKGEKKILSYYAAFAEVNDSVLVYFDDSESSLNIYYNGSLSKAEDAFLSLPKRIKTSSNIVAWVNQSDYFTVFYRGRTYQLDNIAPIKFEVGRDILAYIDNYERRFRIFYRGDTAIVEEFLPDSFKLGFGIVAYVDYQGNFQIFSNGATRKVLADRPDFFYVKGNVVVYSFNNMFNIFYDGKITTLQNRAPADFQLGNYGIAWLDDNGRLMLFHKGKISTVSYEIIESYSLNGNVLKYNLGYNNYRVFYNGVNY